MCDSTTTHADIVNLTTITQKEIYPTGKFFNAACASMIIMTNHEWVSSQRTIRILRSPSNFTLGLFGGVYFFLYLWYNKQRVNMTVEVFACLQLLMLAIPLQILRRHLVEATFCHLQVLCTSYKKNWHQGTWELFFFAAWHLCNSGHKMHCVWTYLPHDHKPLKVSWECRSATCTMKLFNNLWAVHLKVKACHSEALHDIWVFKAVRLTPIKVVQPVKEKEHVFCLSQCTCEISMPHGTVSF